MMGWSLFPQGWSGFNRKLPGSLPVFVMGDPLYFLFLWHSETRPDATVPPPPTATGWGDFVPIPRMGTGESKEEETETFTGLDR